MIELGDEVQDTITKFKGIVVGLHYYLYGCTRVSVQPVSKKGNLEDAKSFDEPQLKILKKGVHKPQEEKKKPVQSKERPGGPLPYRLPANKPTR